MSTPRASWIALYGKVESEADGAKRRISTTGTELSAPNGVAIPSIALFITPLAVLAIGVPGAGGRGPALTVVAAAAFLVTGIGLHVHARRLLGELVE